MAFDFPASPILGQVYTLGSSSYVWNGYGWISEPPTAYVRVKGDTMTGPLIIRKADSFGHLTLDNTTATDQVPIFFTKNDKKRWAAGAGPGPEPGADVASDWHFRRYNDAGTLFPDIPLKINRKTGRAQIAFEPVDSMDIANKAWVEAAIGGGGPEHVLRAGDVMSGQLTTPQLTVSGVPGGETYLYGQSAGAYRWIIRMTDHFQLHRIDNAGAFAGTPLHIDRSTGNAAFSHQVQAGSMWAPSGYLGNFSADSATIGNCNSGGTFSLTTVTCNNFAANTITDYGLLTVSGVSSLNGGANTTTLVVSQEVQFNRGDNIAVIRSYSGGGLLRVNPSGGVVPDYGWVCKPGVFALAQGHWFNISHASGVSELWIDNTPQGQFAFVSDYRIKKDVAPLPSTWEKVKALNPISFTQAEYDPPSSQTVEPWEDPNVLPKQLKKPMFEADNTERWGFLAHELQETLIESAATGYKDAPNLIQSPNPWTMIASLTKALQEAMSRIEYLEARAGISK